MSQEIIHSNQTTLIVCTTDKDALKLHGYITHLIGKNKTGAYCPSWETLPYERQKPSINILSNRLKIQFLCYQKKLNWLVMSANTFMIRLPPKEYIMNSNYSYKCGDRLNPQQLRKKLISWNYYQDDEIISPGSFAIRGSIIDIFPGHAKLPIRIELFDDEIESMRTIHLDDPKKIDHYHHFEFYSSNEFELDNKSIDLFKQKWESIFGNRGLSSSIYKKTIAKQFTSGIHHYLYMLHPHLTTWQEVLPKAIIYSDPMLFDQLSQNLELFQHQYEQLCHNLDYPILPPQFIYQELHELHGPVDSSTKFSQTLTLTSCPNAMEYNPDNSLFFDQLKKLRKNFKILLTSHSIGALDTIAQELDTCIQENTKQNLLDWFTKPQNAEITIVPSTIETSFMTTDSKIIIAIDSLAMPEDEYNQDPAKSVKTITNNLFHYQPGDFVIHKLHGIGRLIELTDIRQGSIETEFCVIEFADHDKIYLPIADLSTLSPYQDGAKEGNVELSKLGKNKWQKTQVSAIVKMADTAVYLLGLYAKRSQINRPLFSFCQSSFETFRDAFNFQDTPDQVHVTTELVKDLTQTTYPMDRLICGDVGFGKTELSMRAAWIIVHSGFQVVFMAPTTILAEQHFERYQNRFCNEAIKIEKLLGTVQQNMNTVKKLANGEIDILIGTHSVLSKKLHFSKPGLFVIDEEQKFGVKQKEKLKEKFPNIDILALSATPIPRTLNMTMSSLRDLSLLSTPPVNRTDIKTYTYETSETDKIIEAIYRETTRGGQVYFCYNRIESLEEMKHKIQKWFPELVIDIGHGQMNKLKLKKVMNRFYHHHTDILLCSSIIESGLDHANANTIIVYSAELFGLSQLHQLRGRVGRSNHQAYAYFFTSPLKYLSKQSQNRIKAIQRNSKIGSGLSIAIEDLEIRGAGDLLGKTQSGHLEDIGLIRYSELLADTVEWLKAHPKEKINPEFILQDKSFQFDSPFSAIIPKTYIHDPALRLTWYSKISRCRQANDLLELRIQLADKFGPLPTPLIHLLEITKIRLSAIPFGISKIKLRDSQSHITFHESSNIKFDAILKKVINYPELFSLKPPGTIVLKNVGVTSLDNIFMTLSNAIKELVD